MRDFEDTDNEIRSELEKLRIEARIHRGFLLRIGSMFFAKRLNTKEVAKRMGITEAYVWNSMDEVRLVWADRKFSD